MGEFFKYSTYQIHDFCQELNRMLLSLPVETIGKMGLEFGSKEPNSRFFNNNEKAFKMMLNSSVPNDYMDEYDVKLLIEELCNMLVYYYTAISLSNDEKCDLIEKYTGIRAKYFEEHGDGFYKIHPISSLRENMSYEYCMTIPMRKKLRKILENKPDEVIFKLGMALGNARDELGLSDEFKEYWYKDNIKEEISEYKDSLARLLSGMVLPATIGSWADLAEELEITLDILERATGIRMEIENKDRPSRFRIHPISSLNESMAKKGDLIDMFLPVISVDEFEPKVGKSVQVIVVGFYLFEEKAAEDFRSFLERGTTVLLDSEVSPNPDEHGHWIVFIEFRRNKDFWEKFENTIDEAERLIGDSIEWKVRPYFGDKKVFDFKDEVLKELVILEPAEYVIKRKHKLEDGDASMKESLDEFFKDALSIKHKVEDGMLIFEYKTPGRYLQKKERLYFKTHSFGEAQVMLESEIPEAVEVSYLSREVVVLKHMLGESYIVNSTKSKIYIEKEDEILILKRYE